MARIIAPIQLKRKQKKVVHFNISRVEVRSLGAKASPVRRARILAPLFTRSRPARPGILHYDTGGARESCRGSRNGGKTSGQPGPKDAKSGEEYVPHVPIGFSWSSEGTATDDYAPLGREPTRIKTKQQFSRFIWTV